MAKFSDRIGITEPPNEFQINSMNNELRNSLWNIIVVFFDINPHRETFYNLMKTLYIRFFRLPITKLPYDEFNCRDLLEKHFISFHWDEIYNLMEIIYDILEDGRKNAFGIALNRILKKEYSGYSFYNGEFIPITNPEEIEAIKEAQIQPKNKGLKNISEHISKATSLLSKKPEPDYHNSIKESINAVEGICKLLTGEKSGGIKDPINILAEKIYIHPALKEGYKKIYGYTSDEGGIRHPMLEDNTVGFAEAKYMLVSCSAFVNYIIDNAIKSKLI